MEILTSCRSRYSTYSYNFNNLAFFFVWYEVVKIKPLRSALEPEVDPFSVRQRSLLFATEKYLCYIQISQFSTDLIDVQSSKILLSIALDGGRVHAKCFKMLHGRVNLHIHTHMNTYTHSMYTVPVCELMYDRYISNSLHT